MDNLPQEINIQDQNNSQSLIVPQAPVAQKNFNYKKFLLFLMLFLLLLAGVWYYFIFYKTSKVKTSIKNILKLDQKLAPGQITKEMAEQKIAEMKNKNLVAQKNQETEVVLPAEFPIELIPVKYEKVLSFVSLQGANASYRVVLALNGTVNEKYQEAKKYFINKGWPYKELSDGQMKIVSEINKTQIIIDISSIEASGVTAIINIINLSDAK